MFPVMEGRWKEMVGGREGFLLFHSADVCGVQLQGWLLRDGRGRNEKHVMDRDGLNKVVCSK